MCGINGFNFSDKKLLEQMNACLKHRGPDDSSIFTDRYISFGHRRLAIIDLSKDANQPMFYTHKKRTVAIIFNGEIYNYQEIKKELKALGYEFKTKSDTEVILASYLAWGEDCMQRFNGMWAFALYDTNNKTLLCSRDRFGKKPFYYYYNKGTLIFSSELKAIATHKEVKRTIDQNAAGLYFGLGFIPAPYTIYQNVSKLQAGENMLFDLQGKKIVKRWTYYEIPLYTPQYKREQLVKEGKELIRDAVRLRLISDVPVGAFLSGGLDSSTVVGEMAHFTDLHKLHTFSIGFEGKYDETPYINLVKDAFGTQHHHEFFTQDQLDELVPKYADVYDEPFGDFSGFPTYAVSKLARKHVTVSLSGDGGDEIFGGYPSYVTGRRMDLIRKLPKFARKIGAALPAKKNLNGYVSMYLLKEAFRLSLEAPEEFYAKALSADVYKSPVCEQWMREKLAYCLERSRGDFTEALRLYDLLFHTLSDHFLVKVDRASMANSIEIRAPFLDYRLVELGQRIPREWKVDSTATKKLMRDIIKDVVPERILNRGKQGFTPPLDIWIQQDKYQTIIADGLKIIEKLDPKLYAFYKEKVLAQDHRLYTIYRIRLFLFALWYKRWMQ